MREMYDALKVAQKGEVLWQEPMKRHTTFKIGGPCDIMLQPSSVEDLQKIVQVIEEANQKRSDPVFFMVMGAGSNLLVSDKGIRGVVVKIAKGFNKIEVEGNILSSGTGAALTAISRAAQKNSLSGLEFGVGIPGTVGGALVMNAGAYGGEISYVLQSAKVMDFSGKISELSNTELRFGYRRSIFLEQKLIALEATFALEPCTKEAISNKMRTLTRQRNEKQPLNMPSAGSVFKRPPDNYVGPLVEKAGLKGYRIGKAEVSTKHAGFIVNVGGATCRDVVSLIGHVQKVIKDKFNVDLEPEIRVIGEK